MPAAVPLLAMTKLQVASYSVSMGEDGGGIVSVFNEAWCPEADNQ